MASADKGANVQVLTPFSSHQILSFLYKIPGAEKFQPPDIPGASLAGCGPRQANEREGDQDGQGK